MKKMSKWAGAGVLAGAVALGAKSLVGLKAGGAAFLGLFSHAPGEAALVAETVSHGAPVVAALPLTKQAPQVGGLVARTATQLVVRIPGDERHQLEALAGDQRDNFLILIAQEDAKALGLKAYIGQFRDWVPETAAAFRRHGQNQAAEVLNQALGLARGSPRWATLDSQFRALGGAPTN